MKINFYNHKGTHMKKLMLLLLAPVVICATEAAKEITRLEKIQFIANYFLKSVDTSSDYMSRSIPDHAKSKVKEIISDYTKTTCAEYTELISKKLNDSDIDVVYNFYKSEAAAKILALLPEFSEKCMVHGAKLQSDLFAAVMQKPETKSENTTCQDSVCVNK